MGVRPPFGYDHEPLLRRSADLLVFYARYQANSREHAWACGGLLPNDLGLFDMLGNEYEWVHDRDNVTRPGHHGSYDDSINDREYINEKTPRLLRGGSFGFLPADVRSACRGGGARRTGTHTSAFAPPGRTTELPNIFAPSAFLILVFMREYTTMYSSTLTRSSRVVPRNRLSLLNWREIMR